MGFAGVSSPMRAVCGAPYTAAVEEKMKCSTPASTQHSMRVREAQVLLR